MLRCSSRMLHAMKIPRRYFQLMFSVMIALLMSLTMSAFMTLINMGFVPSFFGLWMKAFGMGFLVSAPIAIFVIPVLRRVLEKLVGD